MVETELRKRHLRGSFRAARARRRRLSHRTGPRNLCRRNDFSAPALKRARPLCEHEHDHDGPSGLRCLDRRPRGPPGARHRGPRGPREDDARGRAAPAVRHLPGRAARRRPRHGLRRAREGARDHDPRQEHRGELPGDDHQHRGHARPPGLRLRSRADPDDGGRDPAARGRGRGPVAANALRAQEGPGRKQARHRAHQQDRPRRRAPARGARGDPGPLPFPRDGGASPRLPHPVRVGPSRLRFPGPRRHVGNAGAADGPHPRRGPSARHRRCPLQDDRGQHGVLRLPRAAGGRPHLLGKPVPRDRSRCGPAGRLDRAEGARGKDLPVRGHRARRGRGCLRRRHLHDLGVPADRDRPDDPGPLRSHASSRHPRGRADPLHGVPHQRLARVGAVRPLRHEPPSARAPREGARAQRRPAPREHARARLLPRAGSRRALPRHPGGDDPAGVLRVLAGASPGHLSPRGVRRAARALRGARDRLLRGVHRARHRGRRESAKGSSSTSAGTATGRGWSSRSLRAACSASAWSS